MRNDLIVSESIDINVPTAKVWRGLTDPEIIKGYLYGTETITDWKIGSDITFQGEYQGHAYKDKGIVRENEENKLLSYRYWSGFSGVEDKPENYSLVTYTVEPITADITKFTWTQRGFATEDGYNHSKVGMKAFLESVKKVIESAQ